MRKFLSLLLIASFIVTGSRANNVRIGSVTTSTTSTATTVTFTIQWDNSWRGGPASNWDAVWVFFKVKTDLGWYDHLDLTGQNVTAPGSLTVNVPSDKKGCFIYRSANGVGDISSSTITLGVTPQAGAYDLKVFGIEMVYIPEGSFFLGHSGGNTDNYSQAGTGGTVPFEINSAYPPYISNAAAGYLYDARVAGTVGFSSTWPTGFNAYYMMKYELSQAGYRDFLNAAPGYQNNIFPSRSDITSSTYQTVGTKLFPSGFRNNLAVRSSSGSERIGTNADGDATYNESNDGEWTPANMLFWSDAAAFLDWAALRPMTEFEYIKAANGPKVLNYPQFATGTYIQVSDLFSTAGILEENTSNERMQKKGQSIINYINTNEMWGQNTNGTNRGFAVRSGWAADATSGRATSGASYYGVMDLSGNLWEPVVTSANAAGRSFQGNLGDGAFSGLDGNANQISWPGNQNTTTSPNTGGSIQRIFTAGISKMGGGFDQNLFSAVTDVLYNPAVLSQAYPTSRIAAQAYGCRGVRQVLP